MMSVLSGRWKLVTSVIGLEAVARIDENVRPAAGCNMPSSPVKLSSVRQEVVPTEITRPPFACVRLYDVRRLLTHYTEFRVHRVIPSILSLLDRAECAESDVQRNIGERNAFIGDAAEARA